MNILRKSLALLCAMLLATAGTACADDSEAMLTNYMSDALVSQYGLAEVGQIEYDGLNGVLDGTIEDLDGDGESELLVVRCETGRGTTAFFMEVYSPDAGQPDGARLRARTELSSDKVCVDPFDVRAAFCTLSIGGERRVGLYDAFQMNDCCEAMHIYALRDDELVYESGAHIARRYNSTQLFTSDGQFSAGEMFYYSDSPGWELAAGDYYSGESEPSRDEYMAQFDDVMAAYREFLGSNGLERPDERMLAPGKNDFRTHEKIMPEQLIFGDSLRWICRVTSAVGYDDDAGSSYLQLEVGALNGLCER